LEQDAHENASPPRRIHFVAVEVLGFMVRRGRCLETVTAPDQRQERVQHLNLGVET